jgi:hypothetical protein
MVRWGALFLGMLAAAAMISAGAGARTTQTVDPRIDVSSNAGIAKFLISHGIDPKGFVIQRGAHNYAGPSCPGVRWHCTTAKHVVQIMATNNPGNTNQYSCTASTGGTVNGPYECVIIQSSAGSDNNASCIEKIGDPTGTQHCAIYQLNTSGANNAVVQQSVAVAAVPAVGQDATQNTEIAQWAGSGSNNAQVNQDLKESQSASIGKTGTISQTQDGHQTSAVSQHSDSGNNVAKVLQSLQLKASATGGTVITQNQDTNGNGPNTSSAIYQNADQSSGPITSTGTNNAYVFQSDDLNASGSKTGNLTQAQGNNDTGLFNHAEQWSTGVSTAQVNQNEHQSLGASQVSGTLSQSQLGPMWNDPNQGSNTGDSFTAAQSSDQNAGPGAGQLDIEESACGSSGVCNLTEKASNDHQTLTNSCTSTPTSPCDIGITLNSTPCGEDCTPPICSGECTFPPEGSLPPAPNICDAIPTAPGCTPITTTTSLVADPNPSGCGTVTFTATVTPASAGPTPTGNVVFSDSSGTFATVPLAANGTAVTTLNSPASDTYKATYAGDGSHSGSNGTVSAGGACVQ